SFSGEALDYKAPLLKSETAVANAAEALLKYFGIKDDRVISYLGWEQEYFLVDSAVYAQRPDLIMAERTLLGHNSARNQQLEDHYFGSIPARVLEFMKDLEFECYKLGIPLKARHNEVAPNQFECAPVYERLNLANDHNLLLMALMRKVADRHGFRVLLHEKPYAGVNGSGKHCNWSLGTESGRGLMSPGKTDKENLMFLMFMANTLKAVYDHNGLLKAAVMTASNAHRLGANEAPPAIISSFLGSQVHEAFEEMLKSKDMVKINDKKGYSLGIPQVPELLIDNTDRNRTSPFAFTGNRFEYRAVGSSANCSGAMIVLNTALAKQLTVFKQAVDERISKGCSAVQAILDETRETYRACRDICFDGNGYSEEWKKEAAKRGLDCETSTPIIYDWLSAPSTLALYKDTNVMTETELRARQETAWELYSKKIDIEANILSDLTMNHILPVATRYQSILLDNVSKMKDIFNGKDYDSVAAGEVGSIKEIAIHMSEARRLVAELEKVRSVAQAIESEREKAIMYHDKVTGFLSDIRDHVDALEMIVDDEMWPLPKYRELLFIR
ncbi:MAG: glutamine synthetase type III, partial [Candidatus Methanomethylophilaceae archaeon]|nr:glutamine synthetase type III [Candidatus Methanomethylophilaceae archaeon]